MQHDLAPFAAFLNDRFGYDFRGYRPVSLANRLRHLAARLDLPGLPALRDWLLRDPAQIGYVVDQICVPVSTLFREPVTFAQLRRQLFPLLSSFPTITVWHAGCAAGQEAYSMAILLEEAGLLARSRIYASDLSAAVLARAAGGLISPAQLEAAAPRYLAAGGQRQLSSHFQPHGAMMRLDPALLTRISFVSHNLATDAVFCEANLILCRNVLIYFDRPLQSRVLGLFSDSLMRGGRLALGQRETPIGAGALFAPEPGTRCIYRPTMRPRPQLSACPDPDPILIPMPREGKNDRYA